MINQSRTCSAASMPTASVDILTGVPAGQLSRRLLRRGVSLCIDQVADGFGLA